MKRYFVKEMFKTLQGEGFHAGTPAFFIRFAGCNLWSGRDGTRARDALANEAQCPAYCDTDFASGAPLLAEEIAAKVEEAKMPLVVLTGGEPSLQVDSELLVALRRCMPPVVPIAIETNGSRELAHLDLDWITCSPKQAPERLVLRSAHELKVVLPNDISPLAYAQKVSAQHLFVQPKATPLLVGASLIEADNVRIAVAFCMKHSEWRLSYQTHKVIGLP